MSKEAMVEYITAKLQEMDYQNTEMVYGLVLGLCGE